MRRKIVNINPNESLEIEWEEAGKNLSIHKNGVLVFAAPDEASLRISQKFLLPDGREFVILITDTGLELWHAGEELISNESRGDGAKFIQAYKAMLSYGIFLLFLAVFVLFLDSRLRYVNSVLLIIFGLTFLGLGFWAKRKLEKAPLWIGIVLCWLSIFASFASGSFMSIILPGIMVYIFYQGTQSYPGQPLQKETLDADAPLDSGL